MNKKLKKFLTCICTILILFNFMIYNLMPVALAEQTQEKTPEQIKDTMKGNLTDSDPNSKDSTTIGEIASGIVGILTWVYRLPVIALDFIIQLLGGALGGMAGTTDGSSSIQLLTIDDILFNRFLITDINFFDTSTATFPTGDNVVKTIREQIAFWYYVMRIIAIAILAAILIVVGIKMAITTVAAEKAIYKKALFDWLTSLALVFLLHYLIRGIIWINESLVNIFNGMASSNIKNVIDGLKYLLFDIDFTVGWGAVIIYTMLTIQALMFLISYIKRMITLAFLIIISPLITITYSLDKMGDQKAQALNTWLKEFSYNVLIQPFHCILFLVFADTAITAVQNSGSIAAAILAFLCIKFIWDGEKIVRKIFGFEQASSLGTVAASGAVLGAAISKARSAGSTVKSGVKFASNTKTGQMVKQKFDSKKQTHLQNKAAKQIGGKGTSYSSLSGSQKELADKRVKEMSEKKDRFAKIKERKEYNHLKKNPANSGKSEAELRSMAAGNVKNGTDHFSNANKLSAAILSDGLKYSRRIASPQKVAKVAAGVMAAAATYALPDQSPIAAIGAGYAAGKSAETGIRNLQQRKKENFEDNVVKAWERHCAIKGIKPEERTREKFNDWYNNTYSKGKNMDAYSQKKMGKAEKDTTEKLQGLGLTPGDIEGIFAKIQRSVLAKEDYDPSKMFTGYKDGNKHDISAGTIAGIVAGYASMFNESNLYESATAYNTQMNPFGITHEDAVNGIDNSNIANAPTPPPAPDPHDAPPAPPAPPIENEHTTVEESYNQEVERDIEQITEGITNENGEIDKSQIDSKLQELQQQITQDLEGRLKPEIDASIKDLETETKTEIETAISELEGSINSDTDISQIETMVNSALSGISMPDDRREAVQTAATQYCTKVVERERVEKVVERIETINTKQELIERVQGNK